MSEVSLKERLTAIEGLDYEKALRYVNGREALLSEVVKTVAAEADANVSKMRSAFENSDMAAYECIAHSVKGQMATIGLAAFSERAKKHELAAKEGNAEFIKEDAEGFFGEYTDICRKLTGEE